MARDLSGKNIMVIRPAGQNEALCNMIDGTGAEVTKLPTIEIRPLDNVSEVTLHDLIAWSSHIIFISRNSVRVLDAMLDELKELLVDKTVFATGEGTANEARSSGIEKVLYPDSGSGSEGLLKMSELQKDKIIGNQVLIVRGDTGRELLRSELMSRGAVVRYADIYSRQLPEVSPEVIDALWCNNPPDIIVLTSNQGLQNLIKITPEKYQKQLLSTSLVVMSDRIAVSAKDQGFFQKPVVANLQSDQGILDAIYSSMEQKNDSR